MADASVMIGAGSAFLVAVSAMVADLDHQTLLNSSKMQQQRQRRQQDEVRLPGIPMDRGVTRHGTFYVTDLAAHGLGVSWVRT
jgi:hypothetical protein